MYKEEALEFLGINAFHKAGYFGEGIKAMSHEKVCAKYHPDVISPKGFKEKRDHGDIVMDGIKMIAPKATLYAFPFGISGTVNKYKCECEEYIKANKIVLFTTSSLGEINKAKEKAMQNCIDNGCTFFASAGNQYGKDLRGEAKSEKFIAVGGIVPIFENGKYNFSKLKVVNYSACGESLDYVSLANIYGATGISFVVNIFFSMCILVQEFFLKNAGRTLVRSELETFIKDNCVDVDVEGFDIRTGHGLFKLPNPENINIQKYVPEYGKNKEEAAKMSKKVFLGVGHGGSDPGAVANGLKEKDMNLTMALACRDELERHGVKVLLSRYKDEEDALTEEIKECNAFAPNLAIDIHNNAGGGDGFEVYHHSKGGTSKILAQNINNEVVKIGQNSRGLKIKVNASGYDYYGFIRQTTAPAVIVEGVFIDNKTDVQIADTEEEQKAFGVAYAKGILTTLGINYIEKTDKIYRVQVGAYKVKDNAEKTAERLRASGFDTIIKED